MKSLFFTIIAMFFCCCLSAEEPIIRFGVVTDMHYSPKHPENKKHPTRSYKLPKAKLQEAVNTFNQEKVAFTAILGDNIDLYAESFYELKPVLAQLDKPHHIVLGNHDFLDFYSTPKQDSVLKILGVKKPYYSFVKNNIRFIFLDSNDLALYSRAENTPEGKEARALYNKLKAEKNKAGHKYNGTLSQKQIDWMVELIEKSQKKGQQVICFAHMPLQPYGTFAGTDMQGDKINKILSRYSNVKAVLTGHHHEGSKSLEGPVKHYNFVGMIEGSANHYSIVSLYPDRMEIKGYGEQESLTIKY